MPPSRNVRKPTKNIDRAPKSQTISRIRVIYSILLIIVAVFIVRLFYLQIIKHNYYQQSANSDQLKEYEIPAQRGMIEANSAGQAVPIVLNETLYTLFADPPLVKNVSSDASAIQRIIGGSASSYKQDLTTAGTEYVVMAQKISQSQSNAILALKMPGIDTQANNYRTYPDGELAAPVLGFVNNSGQGQYGVEEALNKTLAGANGQVKAVTDAQGIPLVGIKSNVLKPAVNGNSVILTLDIPLQQQIETILQAALKHDDSPSGSVIVMNPDNGNVVAIANSPSYNPADYANVSNPQLYQDSAVDTALEPGSVMKTLTVSAALDSGSISGPNQTFNDPGSWNVDGSTITDIAQDGGVDKGNISVTSVLVNSLNTGATWLLMQMGGGQINQKARTTWYNYLVNHYHLGAATGIQQGYEDGGFVPNPNQGSALDLTYAETSFGQGLTLTPLQLAAADSAVLNGGTYYQPNLVQSIINSNTGAQTNKQPKIWKKGIVKPSTSTSLQQIMESVVNSNYWFYQVRQPKPPYIIGGKTGTAQIASPTGGYYANKFNGTFIGFVGQSSPQYVIMVEVTTPNLPENSLDTYAGAGAAAPIFGSVVNTLINGGYVNN